MYASVSRKFSFSAGHRLMNHAGKCRCPHGHTYGLTVSFSGQIRETDRASDDGMVIDFGDLKSQVSVIIDMLDHAMILQVGDPLIEVLIAEKHHKVVVLPFAPTAENIARAVVSTIKHLHLLRDSDPSNALSVTAAVSETEGTEATFYDGYLITTTNTDKTAYSLLRDSVMHYDSKPRIEGAG